MITLNHLLLIFILVCALAVALSRNLLQAIVIFMSQSLAMSILWILLESPDLAITEAAVGAGIDTLLLVVTLKKIHAIDAQNLQELDAPHSERDEVTAEALDVTEAGEEAADRG